MFPRKYPRKCHNGNVFLWTIVVLYVYYIHALPFGEENHWNSYKRSQLATYIHGISLNFRFANYTYHVVHRNTYRCPKKEFRFFTNKIVLDVVAFMKLQQNPRDVDAFQRICYKSDFYLDKKTVEYACNNVRRCGVTFLQALKDQAKKFDKIERHVRNFEEYVLKTANMGALEFLRYLDANGYGAYMEKNHFVVQN